MRLKQSALYRVARSAWSRHFRPLALDPFLHSSHVSKIGSDVNHLFTQVLPRLRPGVFVHVHDVFWPFEYPEAWVREGRARNEAYLLSAFLQFNDRFQIRCFNAYLGAHHHEEWQALHPADRDPGGSFWMAARLGTPAPPAVDGDRRAAHRTPPSSRSRRTRSPETYGWTACWSDFMCA